MISVDCNGCLQGICHLKIQGGVQHCSELHCMLNNLQIGELKNVAHCPDLDTFNITDNNVVV